MYIPKVVRLQRKSLLTGNVSTMDLPTTQEKLDIFFDQSQRSTRPLIQDLFPELNEDQREFIQTGNTPQEWKMIEKEQREELTRYR